MTDPSGDDDAPHLEGISGEGTDLGRLLSLSDGVFAFAMTLLVVNLVLPAVGASGSHPDLADYLQSLLPALGGYALSFFVIASWWSQHHRLFATLRRYDEILMRLNNVFLLLISMTPFLLAIVLEYGPKTLFDLGSSTKLAVALYSAFQLGTGVVYLAMWRHATRDGRLVHPRLPEEWMRWADRRAEVRILVMSVAIAAAFIVPAFGEIAWMGVLVDRRRAQRPSAPAPK